MYLLLAVLMSTSVFAADYSGCVLNPPMPNDKPDYDFTSSGDLVKNPREDKNILAQELVREGGLPKSVKTTYKPFGNRKPDLAEQTETFSYDQDGRCRIEDSTIRYSHGPDAGKTVVTYHRGFCQDLATRYEELMAKAQDPKTGKKSKKGQDEIFEYLNEFDRAWRPHKREMFGFHPDRKKLKDPANLLLSLSNNCLMKETAYDNAPKKKTILQRVFGNPLPPPDPARSTGAN